jgi:hypothetical protein
MIAAGTALPVPAEALLQYPVKVAFSAVEVQPVVPTGVNVPVTVPQKTPRPPFKVRATDRTYLLLVLTFRAAFGPESLYPSTLMLMLPLVPPVDTLEKVQELARDAEPVGRVFK